MVVYSWTYIHIILCIYDLDSRCVQKVPFYLLEFIQEISQQEGHQKDFCITNIIWIKMVKRVADRSAQNFLV